MKIRVQITSIEVYLLGFFFGVRSTFKGRFRSILATIRDQSFLCANLMLSCSNILFHAFFSLSISSSHPHSPSPFHLYPPRTHFLAFAPSLSLVLSFPLPLALTLSLSLSLSLSFFLFQSPLEILSFFHPIWTSLSLLIALLSPDFFPLSLDPSLSLSLSISLSLSLSLFF